MLCFKRLTIILCFLFFILASTRLSITPPLFAGSCGKIVTPYSCYSGDASSCRAASPLEVEASSCGAASPFSSVTSYCVTTSCSSDSSWMGARSGIAISMNASKGFWVVVFLLLGSVAMKSFIGGDVECSSSCLSSTSSRSSS